jgi:hypothetical protein
MRNEDAVTIYRFWLAQYLVRNSKEDFTLSSVPIRNKFYDTVDFKNPAVYGYNCILSDILVDAISSDEFAYFELEYIFAGRYGSSVYPISYPKIAKNDLSDDSPLLRIDINIDDPIEKVIYEVKIHYFWCKYIYGTLIKLDKTLRGEFISKLEETARDYEQYSYTKKEIQRVGKKHLSRALGLWIWDRFASGSYTQKKDLYADYVNKVEDLTTKGSRRNKSGRINILSGLDEKATFNKLYRITNKCIDLVQVLPFDPER